MMTGLVLAGVAVIGWFGIQHTSAEQENPALNKHDVEQTIVDQYGGEITEIELEKERGRVVYEIEVHDGKTEYDLLVDADTGEVLREKIDDRSDNVYDDHDDDQHKQKESSKPVVTEKKADDQKGAKTEEKLLTKEEAEAIALKQFDGTIKELELYEDDGRMLYEIELRNGNQEADIEIDAKTGEVLELDIDRDDD